MRENDILYPQRTSSTQRINVGVMLGLGWSAYTIFKEIELPRLYSSVLNARGDIKCLFKNRGALFVTRWLV